MKLNSKIVLLSCCIIVNFANILAVPANKLLKVDFLDTSVLIIQ